MIQTCLYDCTDVDRSVYCNIEQEHAMNPHRTVAVFGANGHTGRFVVQELQRRGFPVVVIGRDPARLQAAFPQGTARVATVDDARSLDAALDGVAAVVNCAGPFLDTALPVAEAAIRARAHYFDVTAEQASAQALFDRLDAPAREAGTVVMPAVGFFGGFADLLATVATAGLGPVDELGIGIALDAWWPTEGTRVTGRRNTFQRLVIEGGQLVPNVAGPSGDWEFGAPFGRQAMEAIPFSEIALVHRHLPVAAARTHLNSKPLADLRDASTPPPQATDASGRSAQRFLVEVRVRAGDRTRRVHAGGRDIYGFTAPLVAEAVQRALNGHAKGALTPGQAFDAADYLHALRGEFDSFEVR
jgi:short subunit dehydrogenase-like uncharacterized protein